MNRKKKKKSISRSFFFSSFSIDKKMAILRIFLFNQEYRPRDIALGYDCA
jgi:hypothetical protein